MSNGAPRFGVLTVNDPEISSIRCPWAEKPLTEFCPLLTKCVPASARTNCCATSLIASRSSVDVGKRVPGKHPESAATDQLAPGRAGRLCASSGRAKRHSETHLDSFVLTDTILPRRCRRAGAGSRRRFFLLRWRVSRSSLSAAFGAPPVSYRPGQSTGLAALPSTGPRNLGP
jgi:hypothetical protein